MRTAPAETGTPGEAGPALRPRPTEASARPGRRLPPLPPWLRRGLAGLAAVVVLAGAGAAYQVGAAARDVRVYPPPGRLVDVGGHRLHLHCVGEGGPTVVLESGGGAFGGTLDWAAVQPDLARSTRVCAYDRAGYGWSDGGPRPRDGHRIVAELHALLRRAGVPGPYVLGGVSLGGYYVRLYGAQYPEEVAGVVLVEAAHEDQWAAPEERAGTRQYGQLLGVCARVLTPLGVPRLLGETGLFPHPVLGVVPPRLQPAAKAVAYRAAYCREVARELDLATLDATAAQVRATRRPPGDLPLVVLTAGDPTPGDSAAAHGRWLRHQTDLAGLSADGTHVVVPGATHLSILTAGRAQVTAAFRQVLAVARGRAAAVPGGAP